MTHQQIILDQAEHAERLALTRDASRGRIVFGDVETRDSEIECAVPIRRVYDGQAFADMQERQAARVKALEARAATLGARYAGKNHHCNATIIWVSGIVEPFYGYRAVGRHFGVSENSIHRYFAGDIAVKLRGVKMRKVDPKRFVTEQRHVA